MLRAIQYVSVLRIVQFLELYLLVFVVESLYRLLYLLDVVVEHVQVKSAVRCICVGLSEFVLAFADSVKDLFAEDF